jgi:putative transposase
MLYRFEFAGKFDNRISKYRFWQDTNHAIQFDDTILIEQKMNYTHDNPVRAMIVGKQEDYPALRVMQKVCISECQLQIGTF